MASAKFTIGDMVWSKMKGYCPWPSRIAEPSESSLKPQNNQKGAKPSHLVYFFGSNNFAWLSEEHIKPYDEFKDKNKNGSKSAQFKEGLKQIEEYIRSGGRSQIHTQPPSAASAINNVNSSALSAAGDSLNDFDGKYNCFSNMLYTYTMCIYVPVFCDFFSLCCRHSTCAFFEDCVHASGV